MPLVSSAPGLACLFVGRGDEPRPGPDTLLDLLDSRGGRATRFARVRQIHSDRCIVLREDSRIDADGFAGEGDALLTDRPGLALGIATADCVPIVAYDPVSGALGLVHAGWRGTVAGVLSAAISVMKAELSAAPERMLVSAGPCAGACCYTVGEEVIGAFSAAGADLSRIVSRDAPGAARLDLVAANRAQALDAGVDPERFASTGMCTICRPVGLHSYRREGAAAGRMWLLAARAGATR